VSRKSRDRGRRHPGNAKTLRWGGKLHLITRRTSGNARRQTEGSPGVTEEDSPHDITSSAPRRASATAPASRPQPRSPNLTLGARIRKARHETGLSLAAVAGKDFSRAFLNQIELGRSRPSTRTLQIIAQRLNRTVDYFLDEPETSPTALELTLTEAATRLRRGDPDQALELVAPMLTRVHGQMLVRAQLVMAEGWMQKREVEPAIALLQVVIKACLTGRWRVLAVEAYDRMGSAHYLQRRPHEAGRWFDKALTAYEDWRLTDPILKARIHGHRANIHYVAGNHTEAIAGYQVAIATAEHVLDMQALGGIYEGLAVSFQKAGDLERALHYAQRSLRLFDTLQDVRMGAQLRNNMAEILMEQGRPADAETLFLAGADELARVVDTNIRPHLLAGAAESALNQGRLDDATERTRAALAAAERSADPLCMIAVHRVAGRVAHATGQSIASRDHFEKALEHARRVQSPASLSRVAYDYARILEEQGEGATALIRYREAYEAQLTASRA